MKTIAKPFTRPVKATRRLRGRAKTSAASLNSKPFGTRLRSILVPIDFSPPSEKALACARKFAGLFGAKLTLLHVIEPIPVPDLLNSIPLGMESDRDQAKYKGMLDQLIEKKGIERTLVEKAIVRFGRSFQEITDAARSLRADLIIISTHGYTGLTHMLLGSTTERVVRHAPCAVLVVR